MPAAYEDKILQFHSYIIKLRKSGHFSLSQIANMDEVPLFFDMPMTRTVDEKGVKTVAIKTSGHEKTHFTAVLACCADGTKLPPMLIFKRKTIPKDIPKQVLVHAHEKGWMNEAGMKIWFEKIWSRRPGGLLRKPALLVLDQFAAHLTPNTKRIAKTMKTDLAVIPGGLTSQLQPLDVSVNKPFKLLIREEWNRWMQNEAGSTLTPTGRIKKPSVPLVCNWVIKAWNGVKKEVIIKSFKKCGISNALDGTEDDAIYTESDESDNEAAIEEDVESEESESEVSEADE
jgi:hypothetical protein